MTEIHLLEMVERYLQGELSEEELLSFEEMRKTHPDIDQMAVKHHLFIDQVERFEKDREYRSMLQEVHHKLSEEGKISPLEKSNRLVYLWGRYKKTIAVAASIAGITALITSGMITSITPKREKAQIENLGRKIDLLEKSQYHTRRELTDVKNRIEIPAVPAKFGGTSFLIDGKGFLVTNAHVVNKAEKITVQNTSGVELTAGIIYSDDSLDVAILKINDSLFKPIKSLPYSISKKASADLAEPIFTLGFPRDEIVYGEGYLSAKTGFKGDTLACQISISANPGNSGGPVINKDGQVIGILSTRQTTAEGVVFAIKSENIYDAVSSLKKDNNATDIKLPTTSTINKLERTQQVKKIEECVFMVKGY